MGWMESWRVRGWVTLTLALSLRERGLASQPHAYNHHPNNQPTPTVIPA